MSFDPNVIPPEDRSKAHTQEHIERYKRSRDVCRVHNPTNSDYILYNDKKFSNEQWVIPANTKDLGKGKGNADVPRFVADRYITKMGKKLIYQKSEREWEKIKKNYRREEWGTYEERLAIKTNDQSQWDEITPKLFIGVVERYQMNEPEIEEQEQTKQTFSRGSSTLERLGIADMEIDLESSKQDLIDQIS